MQRGYGAGSNQAAPDLTTNGTTHVSLLKLQSNPNLYLARKMN
jgi:hypothetical protein